MDARKGSMGSKAVLVGGILLISVMLSLLIGSQALGIDHRFDCGLGIGGDSDPRWHALNDYETGNNHYMGQLSDMYQSYVVADGNAMAGWVDGVNDNWTTMTGAQKAQSIMNTLSANYATVPTWVILNEISSSQWPSNATYRSWIKSVVYNLNHTHGRSVLILAPFQNPGNNSAD